MNTNELLIAIIIGPLGVLGLLWLIVRAMLSGNTAALGRITLAQDHIASSLAQTATSLSTLTERVAVFQTDIASFRQSHSHLAVFMERTYTALTTMEQRFSEETTRAAQSRLAMAGLAKQIELIYSAIIQSTIVPPGTKATVEPAGSNATSAELAARDVKAAQEAASVEGQTMVGLPR